MAIAPTIKLILIAEMVEADGSNCAICDNKILVNGYELVVYRIRRDGEKRCGQAKEMLCRECGQKWRDDDAHDRYSRFG